MLRFQFLVQNFEVFVLEKLHFLDRAGVVRQRSFQKQIDRHGTQEKKTPIKDHISLDPLRRSRRMIKIFLSSTMLHFLAWLPFPGEELLLNLFKFNSNRR